MGQKRTPVLAAPDPASLADLIPPGLIEKIAEAGVCLISDIDGTIDDSVPVYCSRLSRMLKQKIDLSRLRRYDFKDVHPDALGMLQATVFSNARMHRNMPLVPGAKEALARIYERGIPVLVLTARPTDDDSLVRATANHLERNEIPLDLLIFSRRKKEIIKELKRLLPDVRFVVADDDPKLAISIYRLKNVTAVLMTAPYNLDLRRRGIVRAGQNPDAQDKWAIIEEILIPA